MGIWYNIKQGFIQLFRNRGMIIASLAAIVAMLLLLGAFFTVTVNVNMITEVVKADYDQVEIFLKDDVTKEDAEKLMQAIERRDGVTSTEYRSPDDALDIMKERWGENGYLLDSLGTNPLPASILINIGSLDDAEGVVAYAGTLQGVEDVQYYKETVDKLSKIMNFLEISAFAVMGFLVIVSIIIVSNTIKITVQARAHEIEIMKYVGASNWFIRGPFLCEGIILGIISAAISVGILAFAYNKLIDAIGGQIFAITSAPLISVGYMVTNMLIIFLALGASIGAIGSIVSMRRYLKA